MTKISPEARALTSLLMLCGEAKDLIASIKRNPADPRRDCLDTLERLAKEMWDHIDRRDITAAASIAFELERAKFDVNARELAPLVHKGRKFANSRKPPNALSQLIDEALEELGPTASVEEVKRMVRKSLLVKYQDSDGSLEWTRFPQPVNRRV
jgi:hypothetical protein